MIFNKDNNDKIKELLKDMDIREDRIIATLNSKQDVVIIPSRKYPLKDKNDINIFTIENTEGLHNTSIQRIYDSIEFKLGKCYNNMRALQQGLLDADITNFKVYIGWAFTSHDTYPVHHCFIVYDNKYVLDPSMQMVIPILKEKMSKDPQFRGNINVLREEAVKISKSFNKVKFSKKSTFGKVVSEDIVYIASEGSVEEGEDIFIKLMETYPSHPIYQRHGMNAHGLSLTQQMIENNK